MGERTGDLFIMKADNGSSKNTSIKANDQELLVLHIATYSCLHKQKQAKYQYLDPTKLNIVENIKRGYHLLHFHKESTVPIQQSHWFSLVFIGFLYDNWIFL